MSTEFAPPPATVVIPTGNLPRAEPSEPAAQHILVAQAHRLPLDRHAVASQARAWTLAARAEGTRSSSEAMLNAFGLSTPEGKALMRLAEALLRTPDPATAWKLLCENLRDAQWQTSSGAQRTVRIAATLLRSSARAASMHEARLAPLAAVFVRVARFVVAKAADHFIVADTIPAALARMRREPALRLCSIDCLGESARTPAQAEAYFRCYEDAIDKLASQHASSLHARHGISIKLSALEPRFGPRHRGTYGARLIPKMMHLARRAAAVNIGLTIDAEEQDRLESTLDVMAALTEDATTRGWDGLGLAVQTYGLRTMQVISWLATQARQQRRRIAVRLVKGAYWDSEIKRGQERGLAVFPVFTDKRATDVSYQLAAKLLFEQRAVIFPQFATHNAMTVASVRALAPPGAAFEFQRLHGMGEQLYRVACRDEGFPPVRVYAPVGSRKELLAYLIRRLLENGANSSFVRQFLDPDIPVATLVDDPLDSLSRRPNEPDAAR